MRSYFSWLIILSSSTTALVLGCNDGASSGSGGSKASTASGAGGSASTSVTTSTGATTSSGGGAGGSGGAAELGPFACSSAVVGYAADVAPVFNGCSGGDSCHALATGFHSPAASYAYLVSQPSGECADGRMLVAPGDPEHSYVIDKLTNHNLCKGSGMPKTAGYGGSWTPRPAEDIQKIYDWICAGAKND